MSAKILHALTDDNPDLQKQIGCMTGIFQLFDRHHIIPGRRTSGSNHKRLTAGHSHLNSTNLGVESNNEHYLQTVTERNSNKKVIENERVSMESPRTSFSSSTCSSSFSYVDCNKTAQSASPSFDQTIFPEKLSRDTPLNQPHASPQLGRRSLDFRDVVKDSIYREAQALSVKTTSNEALNHIVKHIDSPRPLPLSKSVDESYKVGINGKPKVPNDLNESLRVLAKLREAPCYFNEARDPPRSSYEVHGSWFPVPRDSPRFSYDGREAPRPSFESQDTFKSTIKIKEKPRLSLDSREGSLKGYSNKSRSNSILKDLQMGSGNFNNRITISQQKKLETYKQSPSVVARLMGLEALPNSISATEHQTGFIKTCLGEDCESFSRSQKTADEGKRNHASGSPRNTLKNSISPQLRHPDSIMKHISSSRFPMEPAPWRKADGGCGTLKPAFRNLDAFARPTNSSPSVYSEIEKRLTELKFKQSDEDLRALKHILEGMQAKGLLETKKEEDQATKCASQRDYNSRNNTSLDQSPRFANRRNPQNNHRVSASTKGSSPPRIESPIVIMKPAKLIGKSEIPALSVMPIDQLSGLRKPCNGNSVDSRKGLVNRKITKDLTPKQTPRYPANRTLSSTDKKINGRTLRSMQISSMPQQLPRENTRSSGRSSGSVSPRLQSRRLESEKQSPRPLVSSSDATKPRRQPNRQPTDSGSPRGKLRPKPPNLQQSDDQSSEISSEMRSLSHQGDGSSLRSDSSISLGLQMDVEVTSVDRSAEITSGFVQQSSQSLSRNLANNSVSSLKQKKPSARLTEHGLEELATVVGEQPSPVSVLDASFYRDDLPSPSKNISNAFEDHATQNSDDNPGEDDLKPVDVDCLSDSIEPNFSSWINRKKLENIENLVQKLRRLNLNHDETTTDYVASLCENTNPDHRYISEILLASGLLLRDLSSGLSSIQHHPSGHVINPDLFLVLEQTRASSGCLTDEQNCEKIIQSKPDHEKLHRKLVFDAVNEILVQKLTSVGPLLEPWLRANKLADRTLNAQQLLRELCSEIGKFQANNSACSSNEDNEVTQQTGNLTDFSMEISAVVLDVERLIFKDLIDEVVNGKAASLQAKPSRRCRKLFTN